MGCSGSLPPLCWRTPGTGLVRKQHKSWGTGSHRLTFWGENTFSQGGILSWPQPHNQVLAHRTAISTAGQPASPTHGKTAGSCLHWAGPQARTAPSLPSRDTPPEKTAGYVRQLFLLVLGPRCSHAGASPMPVDGMHDAGLGQLLWDRWVLALQKFASVPTRSIFNSRERKVGKKNHCVASPLSPSLTQQNSQVSTHHTTKMKGRRKVR